MRSLFISLLRAEFLSLSMEHATTGLLVPHACPSSALDGTNIYEIFYVIGNIPYLHTVVGGGG